jgi:hypothetical protein
VKCVAGEWSGASVSLAMPSEGRTFPYSSAAGTLPATLRIAADGRASLTFAPGGALALHPHVGAARPEGTMDYDGSAFGMVRAEAGRWGVSGADFSGLTVTVSVDGAPVATAVPLAGFAGNDRVDGLVDPAAVLRAGRFSCDEQTLVVSDAGDYYASGSGWTFTRSSRRS